MADNIKIRTEDVAEVLDSKILATSAHTQLAVFNFTVLPADVNPATDRITVTAHNLPLNQPVMLNSSGTLPGGLFLGTRYYVVNPLVNDFQLSLTPSGAAVDITSTGSGNIIIREPYDSVLGKIAARSPTLDEKQALDNADAPTGLNPFVTVSELNTSLATKIPWKTIGPVGSGADFEGNTDAIFTTALATVDQWFLVRPGTYTFSATVTVPVDVRLIGSSAGATIIEGAVATPLLVLSGRNQLGYLTVNQQFAGSSTSVVVNGNEVELLNLILSTTLTTGNTLSISSGVEGLRVFDCAFQVGSAVGTNTVDSLFTSCLWDTPTVFALDLSTPSDVLVVGSIFKNGQLRITSGSNIRVVANHLNDGVSIVTPVTSVLLRANTPNTNNNETDDFANLLQYIGSPSILATNPSYSSNYAGPAGEDLTSRASALDLLTQWRYEERNFHLMATTEPTTVAWNPSTEQLSSTGSFRLISSHRDAAWVIPQLGTTTAITFSQQTGNNNSVAWGGGATYIGQTFTAAFQGSVTGTSLMLSNPSSATGTVVVDIYATTAGLPSGAPLATSNPVLLTSVGVGATVVPFTFALPPSLLNGLVYAVVLRSTVLPTTSIQVHRSSLNPYAGGSEVDSTTSGSAWAFSLTQDLYFTVTGLSISTITIPSGSALYYVIDRSLGVSDITLTPFIATLGSIPNDADNRQTWVLAFSLSGTLWWRGGGGSRFPSTGSMTGQYFVDGTSRSLLDYLGADDYNDATPSYSDNFSGVQGESLTARLGKTDTLIRRLYEYSNIGFYLQDGSYIGAEPGPGPSDATLTLSGIFYISLPHVAGRFTVAPTAWTLTAGQVLYFSWNQAALAGSDLPITGSFVVANGSVPLPSNYPNGTKYFVFARRVGASIYLWDDTELPVSGGRWPMPIGRTVVRTAVATTLADNVVWTGTNLLWESLALITATGIPVARNTFTNQTTASPGLTDVASGQGLVVTHTWNPGLAQPVTIQKVSLPLANVLDQNQFLWVQNLGGSLVFND